MAKIKKIHTLIFIVILTAIFTTTIVIAAYKFTPLSKSLDLRPTPVAQATFIAYPSAYVSPTPTPTAKPLTFEEMNNLYGPCTYLPTIMYHYIDNSDVAKAGGFSGLDVTITSF